MSDQPKCEEMGRHKHLWVTYDGRAWNTPTHDCSIYSVDDSIKEAEAEVRDSGRGDGVIFKYCVVKGDHLHLVNEEMVTVVVP